MNEWWEGTQAKIMDQNIYIHLYFVQLWSRSYQGSKKWKLENLRGFVYSFVLASNIHLASATNRSYRVCKRTPSISESGGGNAGRFYRKLNGLTATIMECTHFVQSMNFSGSLVLAYSLEWRKRGQSCVSASGGKGWIAGHSQCATPGLSFILPCLSLCKEVGWLQWKYDLRSLADWLLVGFD